MKVTSHFQNATEPLISFEVIPPLRGSPFSELEETLTTLAKYNPPFIDVTSHASGNGSRRARPGTLGICSYIQQSLRIDAVPHILCYGFSQEETEDLLVDLNYMEIHNALALQGDRKHAPKPPVPGRRENRYAVDLIQQIYAMNHGNYLEGQNCPTDFCIGVAGYPEKHSEANSWEQEIQYLKGKIDAGASYIVTQMFFDNEKYYNFVNCCRSQGITVPIIPGLKIITTPNHRLSLPAIFGCSLPSSLDQELQENPTHAYEIGIRHAITQSQELLSNGVPALHFYVMSKADAVKNVLTGLGK